MKIQMIWQKNDDEFEFEIRGVAGVDRNDRWVIFPLSPAIATNDGDDNNRQ